MLSGGEGARAAPSVSAAAWIIPAAAGRRAAPAQRLGVIG